MIMTTEKAIDEIFENFKQSHPSVSEVASILHQHRQAAIEADRAGRWIPVSERLPEAIVLCLFDNGNMTVAFWSDLYNHWDNGPEQYGKHRITHWQPLPTPPEASDAPKTLNKE
jgi:hypothetical protein